MFHVLNNANIPQSNKKKGNRNSNRGSTCKTTLWKVCVGIPGHVPHQWCFHPVWNVPMCQCIDRSAPSTEYIFLDISIGFATWVYQVDCMRIRFGYSVCSGDRHVGFFTVVFDIADLNSFSLERLPGSWAQQCFGSALVCNSLTRHFD